MSIISTVLAREHFSEIINRSAYGKERVILSRRGKGVVAIVPLEDLQLLEAIEDKMDILEAKKILGKIKKEGTISMKKFKEKLKHEKNLYECALEVEKDSKLNREMQDWDVTSEDGLDDESW